MVGISGITWCEKVFLPKVFFSRNLTKRYKPACIFLLVQENRSYLGKEKTGGSKGHMIDKGGGVSWATALIMGKTKTR